MGWGNYYDGFPEYVSVASKKAKAEKLAKKLAGRGEKLEPAVVKGTKIASTFWGQAWNRNLESYQHYENRLPRGRSYVKHGAVIDLKVGKGSIKALVSGSELYTVNIHIEPLKPERWKELKQECSGQITSLIGLLQGKLPAPVMAAVTHHDTGLFPEPKDIRFDCSCPDYADLCKHSAAAAYGVGARLDECPELLFLLRGVDHTELIAGAGHAVLAQTDAADTASGLGDLGDIFGIELDEGAAVMAAPCRPKKKTAKKAVKKSVKKTAKKMVRKAVKKTARKKS
jgi:uncharacterized Zn finger protein